MSRPTDMDFDHHWDCIEGECEMCDEAARRLFVYEKLREAWGKYPDSGGAVDRFYKLCEELLGGEECKAIKERDEARAHQTGYCMRCDNAQKEVEKLRALLKEAVDAIDYEHMPSALGERLREAGEGA